MILPSMLPFFGIVLLLLILHLYYGSLQLSMKLLGMLQH
jgi:hypothetical protein